MRFASVVLFLALVGSAVGQKSFTSPDGTFRLQYSDSYISYAGTRAPDQPYIPVCLDSLVTQSLLACIQYRGSEFSGTNFGGAALQVTLVKGVTPKTCTNPPLPADGPRFELDKSAPTKTINATTFSHGTFSGVAAGHSATSDLYRVVHNGECYELAINITQTTFANFDPGTMREFKDADHRRVHDELEKILDTFEFLK